MVRAQDEAGAAAGLLAGLRVVELGPRLAAPVAGLTLADQGAEVARVVDRRDPDADPVLTALLARGKTELHLDLGEAAGRDTLARLVARADVVIDGLRPAARAALGLDYDALRAGANPGLVSCSIPAFPAGDPRAALPDYEAVAGAAGYLFEKPLGSPRYHDFALGSVMAGLLAADAVVAALIARLRLGRGQHVATSLYQSNVFAQILQVLIKTGIPRGFVPFKMIGTPFMSSWRCRDGRHVYLHVTLPAHNARLLELLEAAGFVTEVAGVRAVLSAETRRDPSKVKSIAEAKQLRRLYEAIFATRTADEWEALLGGELCCIKVRTASEWLRDSRAAGMSDACAIEDPLLGEVVAPGPAVVAPERPPRMRPRTVDEAAGAALLARWEATPPMADVAAAVPAEDGAAAAPLRHPLDGVRVADLSRVIAGPCAARVLAELGADVVSIQNPTGLDWALSFHLLFNAGKRSVTLDFTDEAGKRRLWSVLDHLRPDAFIQNYRHLEVARAAGVGPEAVRARFPGIVYTHLNAYGNEGVWRDRPGFEQVVQAVSGIQMTYGREGAPRLLPTPVIDIGSGLLGAFATLAGLYHRRRTGEGAFATTHLTSMAVLFQLPRLAADQREACLAAARRGGHAVAWDPDREVLADVVPALDGHACVAGPRGDLERWLRHLGVLPAGATLSDGHLGAVTRALRWRRLERWRRSLADAGVADTVAVLTVPKLRRLVADTRHVDPGPVPLVRRRQYPGCPGELTFVRLPIDLSATPSAFVAPPPLRGEQTAAVLGRVGEALPEGSGVIPYPPGQPLLPWLVGFARWGYLAWRSGNV